MSAKRLTNQTAGYSLSLYLLKVTLRTFFVFTNTHSKAPRFLRLRRFLVQVQLHFIKLKVRWTSAVDGGMSAASVSSLMILNVGLRTQTSSIAQALSQTNTFSFLIAILSLFPRIWSIFRFLDLDLFPQNNIALKTEI